MASATEAARSGEHPRAAELLESLRLGYRALKLLQGNEDRHTLAATWDTVGYVHHHNDHACRLWREALDILDAFDHPDAEPVRRKLRASR